MVDQIGHDSRPETLLCRTVAGLWRWREQSREYIIAKEDGIVTATRSGGAVLGEIGVRSDGELDSARSKALDNGLEIVRGKAGEFFDL